MPMRKSFLILFLLFVYTWSWSIFNIAKADDYNKAVIGHVIQSKVNNTCLLYTSQSPRDIGPYSMPSSA